MAGHKIKELHPEHPGGYQPLRDLLTALGWKATAAGLRDTGEFLAQIIGRPKPYSRTYVLSVLHRLYEPGKPFKRAVDAALASLDGVPQEITMSRRAVFQVPDDYEENGAYLVTPSRLCAKPGCSIRFVPNVPWRIYCFVCHPLKSA